MKDIDYTLANMIECSAEREIFIRYIEYMGSSLLQDVKSFNVKLNVYAYTNLQDKYG
jgi:hypothetical protein